MCYSVVKNIQESDSDQLNGERKDNPLEITDLRKELDKTHDTNWVRTSDLMGSKADIEIYILEEYTMESLITAV